MQVEKGLKYVYQFESLFFETWSDIRFSKWILRIFLKSDIFRHIERPLAISKK